MPSFDPSMLPPQPDILSDDMRALVADNSASDWSSRVPPQAVGMFVAAVAQWLSHPRFGVRVQVDSSDAGWIITVGLPAVDPRDDVAFS